MPASPNARRNAWQRRCNSAYFFAGSSTRSITMHHAIAGGQVGLLDHGVLHGHEVAGLGQRQVGALRRLLAGPFLMASAGS